MFSGVNGQKRDSRARKKMAKETELHGIAHKQERAGCFYIVFTIVTIQPREKGELKKGGRKGSSSGSPYTRGPLSMPPHGPSRIPDHVSSFVVFVVLFFLSLFVPAVPGRSMILRSDDAGRGVRTADLGLNTREKRKLAWIHSSSIKTLTLVEADVRGIFLAERLVPDPSPYTNLNQRSLTFARPLYRGLGQPAFALQDLERDHGPARRSDVYICVDIYIKSWEVWVGGLGSLYSC